MSHPTTVWRYTLRFVAPAFLGDADQSGRWRTPPIKAQLRQWWRVAYAAQHGHRVDVGAMREAEAELFGAPGEGGGASGRSLVRLRLDRWDEGSLKKTQWRPLDKVPHPEVDRGVPTADLYLGYGPVTLKEGPLKANAAIQADEKASLSIGLTNRIGADDVSRLRCALHLMHRYGTLGGRSRNGWGSYVLEPLDGTPAWPAQPDASCLRPWRDALGLDWAHAIGSDQRGPLVWTTGAKADWRAAMVELARLKIGFRTGLPQCDLALDARRGDRQIPEGIEHGTPRPRHWLAYPVKNHDVEAWKPLKLRLPNTLRFKLRPVADGQVEGIVFHVPALPPPAFAPNRSEIVNLWRDIHQTLDANPQLKRQPS